MKREIGDFSTIVRLEGEEPKDICKLGQGADCCAFLVCGPEGFECVRHALYPSYMTIVDRLEKGTMSAKGQGGWKGCAWEGEKPMVTRATITTN